MKTTDLFVELVVIGIGAASWLTLLVLTIFGWQWIDLTSMVAAVSAIPALSLIYVLGIVFDRIADTIFERIWGKNLRSEFFESTAEYYESRRVILTRAERLSLLLEYGRSRLRICRGWAVNSIFLLIASQLFIWVRLSQSDMILSIAAWTAAFFVLMTVATHFAWRKLTLAEYRKVHEQAGFLRNQV
jgi:hypothetical protein